MTDEIKAAAERIKQGRTLVRYGTGGPWYGDPQYANDAIVVAEAYIAEQAECVAITTACRCRTSRRAAGCWTCCGCWGRK